MSIMFNPVPNLPKHKYKTSRTRSTQLSFDVIISNFWMQLRFVLAVAGRYTNDCYYAVFPVCIMC